MKYCHVYSAPFQVKDRGRFERLVGECGLSFEENLDSGSFLFDVKPGPGSLFEGIETLGPFLRKLSGLIVNDFRLTVCQVDTACERPFDVTLYRIWAGKVWTVWLDAIESGLCRQAIDPALWSDLDDLCPV